MIIYLNTEDLEEVQTVIWDFFAGKCNYLFQYSIRNKDLNLACYNGNNNYYNNNNDTNSINNNDSLFPHTESSGHIANII